MRNPHDVLWRKVKVGDRFILHSRISTKSNGAKGTSIDEAPEVEVVRTTSKTVRLRLIGYLSAEVVEFSVTKAYGTIMGDLWKIAAKLGEVTGLPFASNFGIYNNTPAAKAKLKDDAVNAAYYRKLDDAKRTLDHIKWNERIAREVRLTNAANPGGVKWRNVLNLGPGRALHLSAIVNGVTYTAGKIAADKVVHVVGRLEMHDALRLKPEWRMSYAYSELSDDPSSGNFSSGCFSADTLKAALAEIARHTATSMH